MKTDIEIAQAATPHPITQVAAGLGIPDDALHAFGRHKAKVALPYVDSLAGRPDGKLILVTAISPTPAGEGKTTTTVGLGDALRHIGKKAAICLREPSLGPVFGMKGGAAGGGHAQVIPMEDINLHFTGDFNAIALAPNLVQTLENNPAFVHGGPFANIAHGCNTVLATRTALKLADYVVTEAGFGADLGAEKFIDIKCRKAGLQPAAAVVVATVRALKYHGGVEVKQLARPDLAALERGMANLERHVTNVTQHYGLPCVVAINHRTEDTEAEVALLMERLSALGVRVVLARHWAEGGAGAAELAREVVRLTEQPASPRFVYEEGATLWEKMRAIATRIYGAADITADAKVRTRIQQLQDAGYGGYPVCVAKTQYSFSTDATLRGAPSGHVVDVREVRLAAGAEFVVMICGDIMTMPGLPKVPSACAIDVDASGRITGLF